MTSWWGTLILFCVSGEQAEENKEIEDTPTEKELENNDSENLENDEETNDLENMEDEQQDDEQNAGEFSSPMFLSNSFKKIFFIFINQICT